MSCCGFLPTQHAPKPKDEDVQCGCFPSINNVDEDAIGDAALQTALLAEKGITEAVKKVQGSLSWSTSGTLGTAMSATIYVAFFDNSTLAGVIADWIYVIILIIIATVIGYFCKDSSADTPQTIGDQLEETVPQKLIIICCIYFYYIWTIESKEI